MYHYFTETGHTIGWSGISAKPFDLNYSFEKNDVILVHWTDFDSYYVQSLLIPQRIVRMLNECTVKEVCFFSGNAGNMQTSIADRIQDGWVFLSSPIMFQIPLGIDHDVSTVFTKEFSEYCAVPDQYPHDFFSIQARELKTAFRLLVQVWLEGKAPKGEDGNVKAEFWAPVENNGALHSKLVETLKHETALVSWSPRVPKEGDDDEKGALRVWASPGCENGTVGSK